MARAIATQLMFEGAAEEAMSFSVSLFQGSVHDASRATETKYRCKQCEHEWMVRSERSAAAYRTRWPSRMCRASG
jgi:predicted 3-demethylubiquinone-9 3-methyltransferase (glyoxalase superfamily)